MNLCAACGQDFGSVSAFDAHRIGTYEYTFDTDHPDGRRCLTVDELLEREWTRDGRARWRRPSDGAPWTRSQNQVPTESGRSSQPKRLGHPRPRRRVTRSPESQKRAPQ